MRAILPEQLATYFDSSPVALSLGRAEGDHELLLTNEGFRNLRARFKSFSGVAIPCGSADEHADRSDHSPGG